MMPVSRDDVTLALQALHALEGAGVSEQEMADAVGVHWRSVRRWLRGEARPTSRALTAGILRLHEARAAG